MLRQLCPRGRQLKVDGVTSIGDDRFRICQRARQSAGTVLVRRRPRGARSTLLRFCERPGSIAWQR